MNCRDGTSTFWQWCAVKELLVLGRFVGAWSSVILVWSFDERRRGGCYPITKLKHHHDVVVLVVRNNVSRRRRVSRGRGVQPRHCTEELLSQRSRKETLLFWKSSKSERLSAVICHSISGMISIIHRVWLMCIVFVFWKRQLTAIKLNERFGILALCRCLIELIL